jgi:hypothetical protein
MEIDLPENAAYTVAKHHVFGSSTSAGHAGCVSIEFRAGGRYGHFWHSWYRSHGAQATSPPRFPDV